MTPAMASSRAVSPVGTDDALPDESGSAPPPLAGAPGAPTTAPLLSLEEIQDNNGATNNGVVDASQTLNELIAAIQSEGGPAYQFRQINPVNNADGGEPGGNIRVGFLFRTDRGLAFVDRPGGTSTAATTIP